MPNKRVSWSAGDEMNFNISSCLIYAILLFLLIDCAGKDQYSASEKKISDHSLHPSDLKTLISDHGDTITIGESILSKGKFIPPDSTEKPKNLQIEQPKIVLANKNKREARVAKRSGVPQELKSTILTRSAKTTSNGNILVPKLSRPSQALPPRFKDAATANIQYLDVDEGLNSSYIWAIIQDKRNHMWFGTYGGGASKYDGHSFTHFTEKNGLSDDYVTAMFEDSKGNIWFGTFEGGITKYDGTTFTNFNKENGFCDTYVQSIMEDRNGNIWFASLTPVICIYDGASFTQLNMSDSINDNNITCMLQRSNGEIVLGTNDAGVHILEEVNKEGYSSKHYTINEGLSSNAIWSILEDRRGHLWFGSENGEINKFNESTIKRYTVQQNLKDGIVYSMLEDSAGVIWFTVHGYGIYSFDGKTFTNYTEDNGLSSNYVWTLTEDNDGNLWLGSDGAGVNKFNVKSFTHYTEENGLNDKYILSILEDSQHNMWFGTFESGVTKYDGISFHHFEDEEGFFSSSIVSIFEDFNGNIWFGSVNYGICKFDGSKYTQYTTDQGLSSNDISTIIQDKRGNIWVATADQGLNRFNGKSFVHYTEKNGLSNNVIYAAITDNKDNIWMATYGGGLSRYNGESFVHYTINEGLSANKISSVYEDSNGNIWFGTFEAGVSALSFKGAKDNSPTAMITYTQQDGLSSDHIKSIVEDKNHNVWIATDRGLNLLINNPDQNNFSDKRKIRNFERLDGLKALDFYEGSVYCDSKNRVWWGSGKSLTMLDINEMELKKSPPELQLISIAPKGIFKDFRSSEYKKNSDNISKQDRIEGMDDKIPAFFNYPQNLQLPYNINHLTFNFSATNWTAQHKIKYSYLLEGLGSTWSTPSSENKVDYRNIPYGKYTFKVKAIGPAGVWSPNLEYEFIIHPPWWFQWWAWVSYAIFAALAVAVFVQWRTVRLHKHRKLLRKIVAERTKDLQYTNQELKKALKIKADFMSTMSHEIRTPLNAILGTTNLLLSLNPRPDQLDDLNMLKISSDNLLTLVNDILDFSKIEAGKITLETNDFNLKSLLMEIEQSVKNKASENGLDFHMYYDTDLPEVFQGDSFRLFQIITNLVSNSIKFTKEGYVKMEALKVKEESDGFHVRFRVEDTGVGIDHDKLESIFEDFVQASQEVARTHGGTGLGLAISRKLVQLMGGEIHVESEVGQGTVFYFDIIMKPGMTGDLNEKKKSQEKPDLTEHNLNILVVEDNQFNLVIIQRILSLWGVRTDHSPNGKSAVEMVKINSYDMILMDIQMPEMDGFTATKFIRSMKEAHFKKIPIIALTAYTTGDILDQVKAVGMNDYLSKPFNREDLYDKIVRYTAAESK